MYNRTVLNSIAKSVLWKYGHPGKIGTPGTSFHERLDTLP